MLPALRRLALCTLVTLLGCPSDDDAGDDSSPGSSASCAEVADHIEALCGDGFGSLEAAGQRYDCETFGWRSSKKTCVLNTTVCDRDSFEPCDLTTRIWVCGEGNDECPPGLSCDFDQEECLQCADDADCDAAMLCLEGWCVRDSAQNRELDELLDR